MSGVRPGRHRIYGANLGSNTGFIVYDFGDGSSDNYLAFGPNENIPFGTGIDVRFWGRH